MAVKRRTSASKAGFVYVMSNAAMPGIVKIGMTSRNPEIRLREINSATGVLPFTLEAVIVSRNAKWTEREVHSKLSGRRVRENREFFRIETDEARRLIFDVASAQRQKTYVPSGWGRKSSLLTRLSLVVALLPMAWAASSIAAIVWLLGCAAAASTGYPRFLREYLTMPAGWGGAVILMAAGTGASLFMRPEWIGEASQWTRTLIATF
ncbi:GIY-YIG nuclease family protein [Agrobacterium rubi]|nr:GIY-YIG nuclease family protein [Agrobacterium rubi]NTF24388.1 GIY-YIG nuclease family protein [Agrobacterium rubi]